MKKAISILSAALAFSACAHNVSNTVLMVDQENRLNVKGVASVEEVAKSAANVVVVEQKVEIANQTAATVSNSIDQVVQNLMANNAVVYRSGFSDSFAPLVVFTENDTLAITEARWLERSAERIEVDIDYVCTVDMGTTKPTVMHRATLPDGGSRHDFAELPDANVTSPAYHAEPREYGGQTFIGYYTVTATILNPETGASCFLWIKASADSPSGTGATLDLPNGVTGGVSGDYTWGDKVLTFTGGVLTGVGDAE